MAVGRVAVRLANELGTTASKAQRFVDEAGEGTARAMLDDVSQRADSRLPDGWWKPVAGAGGLGGAAGGTALVWRQQDVWKAREAANEAENYEQTVRKIIESDLPGEIKLQLAKGAQESAKNRGDDGSSDDGGGLFGQDTQTTLVLLIVAVIVLVYGLNTVGGT